MEISFFVSKGFVHFSGQFGMQFGHLTPILGLFSGFLVIMILSGFFDTFGKIVLRLFIPSFVDGFGYTTPFVAMIILKSGNKIFIAISFAFKFSGVNIPVLKLFLEFIPVSFITEIISQMSLVFVHFLLQFITHHIIGANKLFGLIDLVFVLKSFLNGGLNSSGHSFVPGGRDIIHSIY